MGNFLDRMSEREHTIHSLRQENQFLRKMVEHDQRRNDPHMPSSPSVTVKSISVESDKSEQAMSDEHIRLIVNRIIESEANVSYLPDIVERQLYFNMMKVVLQVVNDLVDTSSINLMGHKVTLDIHPTEL